MVNPDQETWFTIAPARIINQRPLQPNIGMSFNRFKPAAVKQIGYRRMFDRVPNSTWLSGTILLFLIADLLMIGNLSAQQTEGTLQPFMQNDALQIQQLFTDERFPNIVVSKQGTLLATWGSSKVRARRSDDAGTTWGPTIEIADGIHGGGTTVDETSGDVLVFLEQHHPPADISVYRSTDDGQSWSLQEATFNVDSQGHMPSMHMNEHGITLRHGQHAGRLIRASRYYGNSNDRSEWSSHYTNAVFSDDGGQTWNASEPFPENGTGEATIAELSNGALYYNSRVHWQQRPENTRRRQASSSDGGKTWTDWKVVAALPDGHQHRSYGCMAGLTRLPVADRDILIFSNIDTPNAKRERATVWASFDGGETWPVKRLVHDGPSAYSSLTAGRPGTVTEGWIFLHFEGGSDGGSQIAKFRLAWLLQGQATGDGQIPSWIQQ